MAKSEVAKLVPFDQITAVNVPDFEDYGFDDLDNLSAGIQTGFAVVSFKGKIWRVKARGEEHVIKDAEGEPVRKLRCVIVGVSRAVSKTYYEGTYEPGSTDNPDCASADGIRPDIGVPNPQNDLCATCRNNQFGSRVSDAGTKLKACGDFKRLAIVPASDVRNEAFGGPMLLRIPPASLQNLVAYMGVLKKHKVPPFACITEVSFDPEAEYQKLVLKPVHVVVDPAARDMIREVRESPVTQAVLYGMAGTGTDVLADLPKLPQQPARKAVTASEPAKPARKAAPKPKPQPAPGDLSGDDQTDGDEDQTDGEEDTQTVSAQNGGTKPKHLPEQLDSALGDLLGGLVG